MKILIGILITLCLLVCIHQAHAETTTINQKGMPSQGNIIPGSMSCSGISNDEALQNHYCGWYRPNDPYCSIYQVPVCSPQVEYQTLSCPVNQSGAINQSRSYECSTQSWTDWTTTSNNCTPDPPTCIESVETRQLTCSPGFEGLSQEQRTSICSDPYGSPTWTTWLEIYNTCKMTSTNLNNPASPISPISPTNPNSSDEVSKSQLRPSSNARTCNCTGHDCIDNDNRNTSYFGSYSAKHFSDSVN
jgi:hypothetical protein